MHLLNALPQRLDPGATPTFAGLISSSLTSPAATNLTLAGGAGNSSIILTPAGTGGVGIGTTTPSTLLNVYSNAANAYPTIRVESGASAEFPVFQLTDGRVGGAPTWQIENGRTLGVFGIFGGTSSGTMLSINMAGTVSIASTTAGSSGAGALVVAGGISAGNTGSAASYFGGEVTISKSSNQLSLNTTDVATYGYLNIGHFTNGTFIGTTAGSNPASNLLRFGTSGTTRLTIAADGAATFTGAVTSSGLVTGTGNASTTAALRADNTIGTSGTAQYYANFTAGGTTLGRLLRGNGLAGYESNGLNIDNFGGFQIGLNVLGGSGDSFKIRNAGTTDLLTITSAGAATFAGAVTVTGALKLGNAYVAGAVVGTGSITIQDSTGTTYRIPVLV